MTREQLDRDMHHLQDEVLFLGSMVEQAVLDSIDALRQRNIEAARKIYLGDNDINQKRYAIESATMAIIATQQPMAHDLRFTAAVLEIITELERIGDYAKGIANITRRLENVDIPIPMREINQMCDQGISMLHRALSAFVDEDVVLARAIPLEDDIADDLYNKIYRKLIADMIAEPEEIDHYSLLLWVAHNLERLADRVSNICERIVFMATGELKELASNDAKEWEELGLDAVN